MPELFHEIAARAVQARARIRRHVYETPLLPARTAGKAAGATVLFKAENFQLTGSFKLRGATARISAHPPGQRLVTASSGNHGIGAAHAAKALGRDLTVVLPETVVRAKREAIERYGARVILHGAEAGLAERHAQALAAAEGYAYVSPYNDIEVIAGQGTIGIEILEQCVRVDNVFVAMGGGGLIGGIGSVIKAFSPQTRVFGVAAAQSKALADSMAAGRVVETEHRETLADAVAGGIDDDTVTLPLARAVVDRVLVSTERDIAAALRSLARHETMIVEGAAALALAGFDAVAEELRGETSVVLLCGANFDRDRIMGLVA